MATAAIIAMSDPQRRAADRPARGAATARGARTWSHRAERPGAQIRV